MSRTRRHRAGPAGVRQLPHAIARRLAGPARRPSAIAGTAITVALLAATTGAAHRAPPGPVLALIALIGTASAATCAAILIRLALHIHGRKHSFGPCRGAGFLGLGTAFAALTAAAGSLLAVTMGPGPAASALGIGAIAVATAYVTGLLLLPGAAPTIAIRLRQGLDGTGVGTAVFLVAWLLVLVPSGTPPVTGLRLLVGLVTSVALAMTVVTGLRAVRHRPAALACAGGAALTIIGLAVPALGRHGVHWLALAGAVLAAGPPLIVAGARQSAAAPATPPPPGAAGGLAAHPLLAVPVAAAIGVSAYHAVTGGRFDRVAVAVGLALVTAVAVRETLAALDVRRYAGRLAAQQARFRALVAGSADVTMVLDTDLVVHWQSPAAARQLGLSDQDVLERVFIELVHPDDAERAAGRLTAVLAGTAPANGDDEPLRARLRDGFGGWRDTESTVRDLRATPEVGALVVHVRDIGELAGLQRRLDEVSRTDPLTGLPNQRRLLELVDTRLATGARGALVLLNLYGLGGVNDLFGTAIGDAVLIEAGHRLRDAVDPADVVARVAGDRFAVLTTGSALRAYPRAGRLVAILGEEYQPGCGPARLTAAAGVADLRGAGRAEEVLRHAEVAGERARARGAGRVEGYDDGLATAVRRRAALEQRLPAAIAAGDFDLVYQPMLDLRDRRPVAVEALLRWRLPGFGALPAAEVVAAAEELGCHADLDARVLRRACRQLAAWRRDGRDLMLAVNVSPRQLDTDLLPALAEDALGHNGVPADRLVIEVAARDLPADAAPAPLAALRSLGIRVALDHFGTGPLGLAQLPRLPVDQVKVDRSLFADPATALVDVVVGLGARLGFEVAAVGVENEAELATVRGAGCHTGQGELLAPPSHPERLEAFLEEHRARLL